MLAQITANSTAQATQIPNSTLLAILTMVLATFIGGGGLAWWFRSGVDLKLTQQNASSALSKADSTATQIVEIAAKQGQHDVFIEEIRSRMSKLDKIDGMATAVEFVKTATENITAHLVPRPELERQWEADARRFQHIEASIDNIRGHCTDCKST